MRHFWRLLLGIGLVLLGIAGIILPIMPGWIFFVPGLIILGDYCPPLKRFLHWCMRFSWVRRIVHTVRDKLEKEQAERRAAKQS